MLLNVVSTKTGEALSLQQWRGYEAGGSPESLTKNDLASGYRVNQDKSGGAVHSDKSAESEPRASPEREGTSK